MSHRTSRRCCWPTRQLSRERKKSTTTCPCRSCYTCTWLRTTRTRRRTSSPSDKCYSSCWSRAQWIRRSATMCWWSPSCRFFSSPSSPTSTVTCLRACTWSAILMSARCTQQPIKKSIIGIWTWCSNWLRASAKKWWSLIANLWSTAAIWIWFARHFKWSPNWASSCKSAYSTISWSISCRHDSLMKTWTSGELPFST